MKLQQENILHRIFLVFGFLLLVPLAIGLQLLRIQWMEGSGLRALWSAQTMDVIPIPAQRGLILDIHGRELAGNTVSYTVAVDPHFPGVSRGDLQMVIRELARVGTRSISDYEQRLRSASPMSRYVVLERNLGIEDAETLAGLGIRALILEEQYRRRYSYESLAAHVVGYVNHELAGQAGLEASYHRYLMGIDGERQVRRDRSGRIRSFVGAPRKLPQRGHTVVSTLDAHMQAIAEEELRRGIERGMARRGSVIIMEPGTGAIKAMAGYPAFDPNRPSDSPAQNRRNPVISDLIEPGSTFKLVTAVAAVENELVGLDEIFDTGDGRRLISGQLMRDHDPMGRITFREAMQRSSNIATSEVAARIPADIFYQYARNFGFGTPTYVDLPGEEPGLLRKPYQWSAVSLPWMSIGYEVQISLLQLAQAYAAFANNGVMMRPYVVDRVVDESGKIVLKNQPERIRNVIKPSTVHKLLPVFQNVVSDSGTAGIARIEGFNMAGKTGTAQKFIDGRYRTRYLASFAGFFPAEQPKYVCLVLLDEPRLSFYGGFIAGPVFRNIAMRLIGLDDRLKLAAGMDLQFESDRISPDFRGMSGPEARAMATDMGFQKRVAGGGRLSGNTAVVVTQEPGPGSPIRHGDYVTLYMEELPAENMEPSSGGLEVVPDVMGLSMRRAVSVLQAKGFDVQIVGSGTVHAQFPTSGEHYRKGQSVTIRGRARDLPSILSHRGH